MFDIKPANYLFMTVSQIKKKEFGVAESQAIIQMDDIKYQMVPLFELEKKMILKLLVVSFPQVVIS